ncbi:MAG: beta-eliminating lyase-related protein [Pseudomonadota bacterium]
MSQLCFASDNAAATHPQILDAIHAANGGYAIAYGDDPHTKAARARFKEHFGDRCEVFFLFNGTGANTIGLAALTDSFDAVICASSAHIWEDECAAPEHFFGGKLLPVAHDLGRISPASVAPLLGPTRGVHHARPRVIAITQPTEFGVVYRPQEIQALADLAHENGLALQMDGARIANAAAFLQVPLSAITTEVGVDVLSFGGTKNGLLGGEALVIFNPDLVERTEYLRKQATQLASKMRFISCQFERLLHDDLWLANASHANAMAKRLENGIASISEITLTAPVEINALFPKLPRSRLKAIQECGDFYMWSEAEDIARWMTSFQTTPEEVDEFLARITDVCSKL